MKIDRYYQGLPNSGYDNQILKLESIFKDNDIIFYKFNNEEICNEEFIAPFTTNIKDIRGKMFVELATENDIWKTEIIKTKKINDKDIQKVDGTYNVEIPPIEDIKNIETENLSNVGKIKLIPPSPKNKTIPPIVYDDYIIIKEENIEEKNIKDTSIFTKEEDKVLLKKENDKKDNNDPISILINSAIKNDIIIPMQMSMSLPSKELFNIISKNFINGDEKFVDVILSQINYDKIGECLREALLQSYKYEE